MTQIRTDVMRICRSRRECFFFFQAEDGIRDLVRSRGLGDVYKRQVPQRRAEPAPRGERDPDEAERDVLHDEAGERLDPVSYTHLTLPTRDLV